MPFARNRGQRIHYTVDGSGSLVILQHGLLMDADSWTQSGIVDALADGFRVACVDSATNRPIPSSTFRSNDPATSSP